MPSYKLVVLSDAADGHEAAYNEWYSNRHLQDIVAIPGFVSAQRFAIRSVVAGAFQHKYLALYDLETDDPDAVLASMMRISGTDAMYISDAIDIDGVACGLFEACSPVVARAGAPDPAG